MYNNHVYITIIHHLNAKIKFNMALTHSGGVKRLCWPAASPFFRIVQHYFDDFERVYPERYEKKYGFWRKNNEFIYTLSKQLVRYNDSRFKKETYLYISR